MLQSCFGHRGCWSTRTFAALCLCHCGVIVHILLSSRCVRCAECCNGGTLPVRFKNWGTNSTHPLCLLCLCSTFLNPSSTTLLTNCQLDCLTFVLVTVRYPTIPPNATQGCLYSFVSIHSVAHLFPLQMFSTS
jgi:hypothetical protein